MGVEYCEKGYILKEMKKWVKMMEYNKFEYMSGMNHCYRCRLFNICHDIEVNEL